MSKQNQMINVKYVQDSLGTSKASAYRIIRQLNSELEAAGVRTIPGKVSLRYFEQVYFSVPSEEN